MSGKKKTFVIFHVGWNGMECVGFDVDMGF